MVVECNVVIGGMLLGIAAGILLLIRGRILGCSGMVFRCASLSLKNRDWDSWFFLAGIFLCGLAFSLYQPVPNPNQIFHTSWGQFFIGGLFTGIGTFLGNGCTSGHGLCGLSLLRKRSFVAVSLFFSVAILTSWIIH
ncbi:YeeE/YedE family protein [Legionella sp. W05-934-2]|uniref:YeeE/YedE family protein n=1 Tax=Legionella sp. W05-934-2 TaxID=1198649 RepID=UPI00346237DB